MRGAKGGMIGVTLGARGVDLKFVGIDICLVEAFFLPARSKRRDLSVRITAFVVVDARGGSKSHSSLLKE